MTSAGTFGSFESTVRGQFNKLLEQRLLGMGYKLAEAVDMPKPIPELLRTKLEPMVQHYFKSIGISWEAGQIELPGYRLTSGSRTTFTKRPDSPEDVIVYFGQGTPRPVAGCENVQTVYISVAQRPPVSPAESFKPSMEEIVKLSGNDLLLGINSTAMTESGSIVLMYAGVAARKIKDGLPISLLPEVVAREEAKVYCGVTLKALGMEKSVEGVK